MGEGPGSGPCASPGYIWWFWVEPPDYLSSAWARPESNRRAREALWRCCSL